MADDGRLARALALEAVPHVLQCYVDYGGWRSKTAAARCTCGWTSRPHTNRRVLAARAAAHVGRARVALRRAWQAAGGRPRPLTSAEPEIRRMLDGTVCVRSPDGVGWVPRK